MSYLTGSGQELIYNNIVAGAAQASFTAERALFDVATVGPRPVLPANFWLPGQEGRAIQIRATGILSSTATPTYTFTVRLGANASTTAAIILGSAALTTGSGVTNQYWEFMGVVTLTADGDAGANSTFRGSGMLHCGGLASPFAYPMWGGAASPGTVATGDLSIANYINMNITCSASSASNTITGHTLQVWGLN